MVLTRAQFMEELVPGVHAWIGLDYKEHAQEWSDIFETDTSKRSFEEEGKLVGFGAADVKDEGTGIAYDEGAGEAWLARYTMTTFGLGFILTEEAIDDNQYDSLTKRYGKQLGTSMRKTKEINCANILNLAFSGSFVGGDGVALCSASHPTKAGTLNSNLLTTGSDLNEGTLEQALIQTAQFVDERGWPIAAQGRKLHIPLQLEFVAERILASPYRTGTADNDINAMKSMGKLPGGFKVNHYFTNPTAWFVQNDIPDGLKLFQRKKLTKKEDGDFDTSNVKFKAYERYAVGWTDPLQIVGSQGV